MMNRHALLIGMLFALLHGSAAANDNELKVTGQRLAANCANCHGTNGVPASDSPLPALAGQPVNALITAMKEFKAGTRPATIMHQLAKGYTDEQIALIAAYFSAQKP